MELYEYAVEELKRLRKDNEPDEMQDEIEKAILEVVKVFSEQDHSELSASYCISILHRLLQYKNITPLTGEDDEWLYVTEGVYQNKRRSTVFKQADRFNGQAYDIEGIIFSDDGGKTWYTNINSFVPITFPYYGGEPERIIIKDKEDKDKEDKNDL